MAMENRVQAIYEEGIKFYKKKNYNTAASIFVKLAHNQKDDSSINFFAGVSLFMIRRFNTALPFLKKVVELKRNHQQTMKSCIFLAYIYIRSHKHQEAFDVLQLPLEAKFNDPYIYSLMGYISHYNKKYKEASTYFKKCLDIDAENPLFNNNYGYNLMVWKKDYKESIPYLEKAIHRYKKNPAFLHSLGWALFLQKRYPEGEKILEKALKIKKNKSSLITKHLNVIRKKINPSSA